MVTVEFTLMKNGKTTLVTESGVSYHQARSKVKSENKRAKIISEKIIKSENSEKLLEVME